jgi:hypothetical protein
LTEVQIVERLTEVQTVERLTLDLWLLLLLLLLLSRGSRLECRRVCIHTISRRSGSFYSNRLLFNIGFESRDQFRSFEELSSSLSTFNTRASYTHDVFSIMLTVFRVHHGILFIFTRARIRRDRARLLMNRPRQIRECLDN